MTTKQALIQKIKINGVQSLSDQELLEFILLHTESKKENGEALSRILLSGFSTLKNIADIPPDVLITQMNLTENSAILLKLIPAICHEISTTNIHQTYINSISRAKTYFENLFLGYAMEHFAVVPVLKNWRAGEKIYMDSGNHAKVSLNCRDIVSFAVTSGASQVILGHNHPDGSAEPSDSDIQTTGELIELLSQLNIRVLDHIIVGRDESVSLRESSGLLNFEEIPGYIAEK